MMMMMVMMSILIMMMVMMVMMMMLMMMYTSLVWIAFIVLVCNLNIKRMQHNTENGYLESASPTSVARYYG